MGKKAMLRQRIADLEASAARVQVARGEERQARERWLDSLASVGLLHVGTRKQDDIERAAKYGVVFLDAPYILDVSATHEAGGDITLTVKMVLTAPAAGRLQQWMQDRRGVSGSNTTTTIPKMWPAFRPDLWARTD